MKNLLPFSLNTVKKSEYEIYAYCLMESHVHLLIKEGINLIFSIAIFPLKVLNVSNRGSQTITSPLAIMLKGLLFFLNYFPKKEGFLKVMSYT
jgi:hypothetical protein